MGRDGGDAAETRTNSSSPGANAATLHHATDARTFHPRTNSESHAISISRAISTAHANSQAKQHTLDTDKRPANDSTSYKAYSDFDLN